MPADQYLVRFVTDDDARDTITQTTVQSESIPWPPHKYAVIAMLSTNDPEAPDYKHLAAVICPDRSATRDQYVDYLAALAAQLQLLGFIQYPEHPNMLLSWFTRIKTSEWGDEIAEHPNLMRGCIYRLSNDEELAEWLGAETAAQSFVDVVELPGVELPGMKKED